VFASLCVFDSHCQTHPLAIPVAALVLSLDETPELLDGLFRLEISAWREYLFLPADAIVFSYDQMMNRLLSLLLAVGGKRK
jgi:hypothetical protein